jgi:hypothetical protein
MYQYTRYQVWWAPPMYITQTRPPAARGVAPDPLVACWPAAGRFGFWRAGLGRDLGDLAAGPAREAGGLVFLFAERARACSRGLGQIGGGGGGK